MKLFKSVLIFVALASTISSHNAEIAFIKNTTGKKLWLSCTHNGSTFYGVLEDGEHKEFVPGDPCCQLPMGGSLAINFAFRGAQLHKQSNRYRLSAVEYGNKYHLCASGPMAVEPLEFSRNATFNVEITTRCVGGFNRYTLVLTQAQ